MSDTTLERTAEERYVDYTIEFVEEYKRQTKLLNNKKTEILPEYLSRALAEYGSHSATLVAEYSRLRGFLKSVERQKDKWYAKTFMDTRKRLQNEATTSKTIAVKEIEMAVKTYHADKYYEFEDAIEMAELKLDFIEQLLKFWKKQDQVLSNLSFNMRSELKALSIVARANGITEQEKAEVIKKRRGQLVNKK